MARMGSTSKAIMGKIGFACKWIDTMDQCDGIKATDDAKQYNLSATTVAWLNRQTASVADDKMWELIRYNISATKKLVERVGELDESLRMVRLGSDILPVYTEPTFGVFYRDPSVIAFCEKGFGEIGAVARARGVRLSFHPGQFVVLASESDIIVDRSIEEFEYHADMAKWMGYGREFQDFKINVHISGKRGAMGIRSAYGRLSPEARNCITIENEEVSHGLDTCNSLGDLLPIVLDVHHHWVREGEYIDHADVRVKRVIDSWRGVRPTMHYSISREDVLVGHDKFIPPNRDLLLNAGHKKQKLRAHSDTYWNQAVNEWAASFTKDFDIMCEAKAKRLASFEFAKFVESNRQTLA
jgi:UV DNA damage endonuclease